MKKIIKRVLLLLVVLFIAIQFFRPAENKAQAPSTQDIATKYTVPAPVMQLLQRSCYDCHSDNTSYPWYNKVQPIAWFLDNHVREGKRELNFSIFASYTPKKAAHKLDEIISEVGEHEMPLSSYLWIHRSARLSDEEIEQISNWASALGDTIRSNNNLPQPQ